ncbi:MAG: DNA cytosine methyltransferase [Deferribacterales bacterium]
MRILNLFSGIGGNRELWTSNITAVEVDPLIAAVYSNRFSSDTVVIGDALSFVEFNYNDFDFIWASPPCPSHGQYRHNVGVLGKGFSPIIPDMTSLYGLITFLKTYYKGLWAVENTMPYYDFLIKPTVFLQRHPIWSNFPIPPKNFMAEGIRDKNKISDFDGFEIISKSKIKNKRQVMRNCVNPEIGKYVLDCAVSYRVAI